MTQRKKATPAEKTVKLNETAMTKRSNVVAQVGKILGDSGTQRYSGYYSEEYNPDWRDDKRVDNVEEMRRGDASCKAAIRAIKAPLLAAKWTVKTADDSPKGEDIRLCAEQAIFSMEGRTWDAFLREALEYLSFGHYTFELIWGFDKSGKLTIKDLAPRIPSSIQRWELTDGRKGIVQFIRTNEFKGSQAEIPQDKLLILTNDKEGDDVTGQSILRSAWKHYQIKQTLYKISAISAERYGVGIPTVWLPEGAGQNEKDEAEDIAGNLRATEKGFVVMPGPKDTGWDLEIKTPSGNPQANQIEENIKHHDKKILVAVLANFLGIDDSAGSYARSQDLSSFFLNTIGDMASYLSEEIGRQVIKRVVDVNYGPQEVYPELHHTPLGDIDTSELATTMLTLARAGFVQPNARNMQWATEVFGLPAIPEEELEAMKEAEIEAGLSRLESGDPDGMDIPNE